MLSGSSLACLHKPPQAHFTPRVEERPIQGRTEILGIIYHQATARSQAEFSLKSKFRCRQSEGPNVYVLALIARLYGGR